MTDPRWDDPQWGLEPDDGPVWLDFLAGAALLIGLPVLLLFLALAWSWSR